MASDSAAVAIGRRIASMRGYRRLTQSELGQSLGITKQTLSGYERGRHVPDATMVALMYEVLDCSADYLLGIVDDPFGVFQTRK